MASVTHQPFDYFLDLDLDSFKALLEIVLDQEAARWKNKAYIARLAHHAENKDFTRALEAAWGRPKGEGGVKDADAFLKKFGKGI